MQRAVVLGGAAGFACALIWGGQAVLSRLAYQQGLGAVDITILRFSVSGLLLLPVALRLRPSLVGPLGWRRSLTLCCLAGAPYATLLVAGSKFAPALHSAVVMQGLTPVFAALFAFAFLQETPSRRRSAALLLLVVGVGVFAGDAVLDPQSVAWRGDLIFVVTACAWAGFSTLSKIWGVDSWRAAATICAISMLALPIVPLVFSTSLGQVPILVVGLHAAYHGVLVGVVSLYLYLRAVALLGPALAALFLAFVPVIAVTGAIMILNEQPSRAEMLGAGLVFCGVVTAFWPSDRGRTRAQAA